MTPSGRRPSAIAPQVPAAPAPDAYARFREDVQQSDLTDTQKTDLKRELGEKAKVAIARGDYDGARYYLGLVEVVNDLP